ncbi:LOW QUALITY PROTEIN: putative uncharacterized protein DDB_G0290989 [Drosophila sulfurigaster albostrigata]|uniref:LOW QUALITY PROTEIN: putative uncharacterized protein DDB_G0290989 n=1 Tax=Drosophila sulfurigaster albostrigata TaxID=89887 RepID=UPI002D21E888|nr:LOW QUALITY PROTEIN: putative uncharacterized protein DDB_G0290989 [Drosophila sulfurigaster albostrigata]
MLNGKFYTGLPPKMVERQSGNGMNRQESHFFWPDDTRVDSAVETRVKRRGSLEAGPTPLQTQRQSDNPDVNTRQMFHKEFAKSSIQFYDNLQPNSGNNQTRLQRLRREVTPKLTDVEPDTRQLLPHKNVEQEDPSAARRKQAYSSKIQFYDYVNVNEGDAMPNNNRRPKMDMNNKREVELNSKNSPKLQVKHNVRHLSVEREQQLPRMVTKKPLNDGPNWEREQYVDQSMRRAPVMLPKKILKQQRQEQQPWIEDYEEDYIDNGMRQLRLRSPAPLKKHVTYNEEADEYAYYDEAATEGRQLRQSLSQPNMRTGSGRQQQQQQQQRGPYVETGRDTKSLNNYNKKSHNNYNNNSNNNNSDYNNELSLRSPRKMLPKLPELETSATRTTQRSRRFDDTLPTTTTTTTVAPRRGVNAGAAAISLDPRKHLRSSLCFNGDALVVDVGAAAPSTSAVALARRSSAGQRVSVGLPD